MLKDNCSSEMLWQAGGGPQTERLSCKYYVNTQCFLSRNANTSIGFKYKYKQTQKNTNRTQPLSLHV